MQRTEEPQEREAIADLYLLRTKFLGDKRILDFHGISKCVAILSTLGFRKRFALLIKTKVITMSNDSSTDMEMNEA